MGSKKKRSNPIAQKEASVQPIEPKPVGVKDELRGLIQSFEVEYRGPLPPPGMLEQYNRLIPNGAERIMKQFEEQSSHRRDLERRVIRSDIVARYLGMGAAFIIGLAVLWVARELALAGQPLAAIVSIATAFLTFAGAFVWGRMSQSRERVEKAKRVDDAKKAPSKNRK